MLYRIDFTLDTGATWRTINLLSWAGVQRWFKHERGVGVVTVVVTALADTEAR